MRTKAEKFPRKHIGAGRKIVSLYADSRLHERMKARAASLGMNVSSYVAYLAKRDLAHGGEIVIVPEGPAT